MNDDFLNVMSRQIAENLREMQTAICYDMIKKAGLWEEFLEFTKAFPLCTPEVIKEFGRLHPDKFAIPEQDESYGKFVQLEDKEGEE